MDGICWGLPKGMGLPGSTSGNRWCVGNIDSTESEVKLHEMWIQDFCKSTPKEIGEWIQDLDYK